MNHINKKKTEIFISSILSLVLCGSVQAATPVWTYSAPSPAQLSVSPAGTGTVQYTVTNQSKKAKTLLLQATPGLSASVCHLPAKDSTCTLTLTVSGSQIPEQGIHAGPVLCEQGNSNQCYGPAAANQLKINRPSTAGHLLLSQYGLPINTLALAPNDNGVLLLSNTGGGEVSALDINLPFGWHAYFTNNCPALLAPQQSCSIFYSIPPFSAVGILNPLMIQGGGADNSINIPVSIQAMGAVNCWGNNNSGQLGNGTSGGISNIPVSVSNINSNALAITGGTNYSCALLATGAINCWGNNVSGQLGNGNNNNSNIPVPVSTINNAVAITAGNAHSCALLNTGAVNCWGDNAYGQLGNGNNNNSSIPLPVSTINNAVAITAGANHSCVLLNTGEINCWGANNAGQLGNNSNTDSNTPVPVSTINNAVAITAGANHSCALLNTGAINCWGDNAAGQLGTGSNNNSNTPIPVNTINNAVTITAGNYYSCAQLNTGAVNCWGLNNYGQLGNGGNIDSRIPVPVNTINNAVAITAGNAHCCALRATGEVNCWGNNVRGQLGDGTSGLYSNTPVTTCPESGCPGNLSALGIFNHNLGDSSCAIVQAP